MQNQDRKRYEAQQKAKAKAAATAKAAKAKAAKTKATAASKKKSTINTSYYNKQIKNYNAYADNMAKQQIATAKANQQAALKQAYVNRMQNQTALNNSLAVAGIRGGATETAGLNLANQYGQAVIAANSDYANAVNAINQTTAENKFNNQMQTESAKRQYIENRQAEARANKREDKQIKYERKTAEEQKKYERKTADYTAKYSKYFSVDKLKKARKKAKTSLEKQIIDARIGYVKSVEKGDKWTG